MTELPTHPESLLAQTAWLQRLTKELVRDPNAADDLAQDTMLAALGRPGPTRAGLRTWLERIARNLAAGATRARYRRQRREQRVARVEAEPSTADTVAQFSAHRSVVEAVTAFDEPVRTTFLLRYWEDLPPREIAARMGVPVETVRTRIKRGLQRLRGQLDAEYGGSRAWVLPLVALSGRGSTTTVVTSFGLTLGALVMMKTKSVAAAVVAVLGLLGAYTWWPSDIGKHVADSTPASADALDAGDSARLPGSDGERSTPAAEARTKEEIRAVVEGDGEFVVGRVVDDQSRPLPDVEVCVVTATRVDEYRYSDAPDLTPRKLRIARICAVMKRISRNGRIHERRQFGEFLNWQNVTRSDQEGVFRFRRGVVHDGDLVGIWSPVYGCRFQSAALQGDRLEVVCETWPRIRGQVKSATGALLKSARVTVGLYDPSAQYMNLETDAEGRYASPQLPPGRCYATFEADRHRMQSERFDFTADLVIDKVLPPLRRLYARLIDSAGRAWSGARIAKVGWRPEELRFILTRQDFKTRTELDSYSRTRTELELAAEVGTVSGFVEDEQAHVLSVWRKNERVTAATLPDLSADTVRIEFPGPVVGTTLAVGITLAQPGNEIPELALEIGTMAGVGAWHFTTDAKAKGRRESFDLAVPAHLRGQTCRLVVTAPGYAERLVSVSIPREGFPAPCQVELYRADNVLRGRVVDAQNHPIRGARITIGTDAGGILRSVRGSLGSSNVDGEFSFKNLADGNVRLFVRRKGYAGTSVLTMTKRTGAVVIRIERGEERTVRVGAAGGPGLMLRVLDGHGDPLLDDRLYGSLRHGSGYKVRVSSDAHTIEAWRPGAATPVSAVEVGDATTLDLRPRR